MSALETFLINHRPEAFDGRHRDTRAEDWLIRFDRYCNAAQVPETGQVRILFAGLLLTESASIWYDQLGTITSARINGVDISPYGVFQYKFRQRYVTSYDAKDAFGRLRALRQKRSVNEYVIVFERLLGQINDFDDRNAVRFFRRGLRPKLRQLVDNHTEIAVDDINGLIALALRLDKTHKNGRQFNHYT
ncbi:hypothetical protein BG006_011254 [Podila minutissima]|uniref:Retrotransposon gag domain-containing protein n=1 Tax=Podila minutissima TaxID=64525 RepID=A0A9P5VI33_9FUNG|nr:hypothetical protein BG006_011254 [Podila minutissima]